ncbi:hypothetical protein [Xenorhabdus hominickii]|uniref:Lipoprotein n=1 Tax=Xenorhabdus hominickii TaxID=351679 RepID=A0A2G0Q2N2_XENHO|nr:hypothetical protein [Xenorhabdus hominickii]AOM39714.1 hypothetical protein A9255_03380 [Xenorhabdus hominickii]PHM53476.1 hypothetical protein Xhom_03474 [Xenorhabdus hominickii]
MKKLALSIIVCASLTACMTRWVPITSNPTPLDEAKRICDKLALKQFPVKNEVAYKTNTTTIHNSYGSGDKKTTYDQTFPKIETYIMDVNEGSRKKQFEECMNENGWES